MMVKRNVRDLPSSLPRKKLDIVIEVSMMAHNALRPQVPTSFPSSLSVGFVSCGPRMIVLAPDHICFLGKKGKNKEQKGCAG